MYEATGQEIADYDGMAEFYVRKFEDWANAFKDPEYMEKINPDELKFADVDSSVITVGSDYIIIENGEIMTTHTEEF